MDNFDLLLLSKLRAGQETGATNPSAVKELEERLESLEGRMPTALSDLDNDLYGYEYKEELYLDVKDTQITGAIYEWVLPNDVSTFYWSEDKDAIKFKLMFKYFDDIVEITEKDCEITTSTTGTSQVWLGASYSQIYTIFYSYPKENGVRCFIQFMRPWSVNTGNSKISIVPPPQLIQDGYEFVGATLYAVNPKTKTIPIEYLFDDEEIFEYLVNECHLFTPIGLDTNLLITDEGGNIYVS